MLQVKSSKSHGCLFLGKGIVNHPEMGVVVECREVVFDKWDIMRTEWFGRFEETRIMYRTDTGYSFDETQLQDGTFQIEQYAPNWRARKKDAWGLF